MSILITGGGSKIGTKLGHLLKETGRDVVFASRSGQNVPEGFKSTKLDWYDKSTFETPFQHHNFEIVYLLPPPADMNSSKAVIPFIDIAVAKGVKKFLLLSGSQVEKTGNAVGLGSIHGYLHDKGLDYVSLRPTSFTENLLQNDGYSIKTNGEFSNNWPTARVPYIATADIAQAAFEIVVNGRPSAKEVIILGPEAITCDELATVVSEVLGKQVKYRGISTDEEKQNLARFMSKDYADSLGDYFAAVGAGGEDKWTKLSEKEKSEMGIAVYTGKTTVREWLEKNKAAFD